MRTTILAILALSGAALAQPTEAERLLCIPEVAAVTRDANGSLSAGRLDTEAKFIQSREGDRWVVRMHPQNVVLFDRCESEYFCDSSEGFGGAFLRERDTDGLIRFTALWMTADSATRNAMTAKGYCTRI